MKEVKKPTCESKGHVWQGTTSPLIFRCGRTGCKAMQHCINGVWHETQPHQPMQPIAPAAQQMDMWA